MTLLEAIDARHSVRVYRNDPLPEEIIFQLNAKIDECNREGGLHIQLITEEPKAFSGILSYGVFKGVRNYLVMVGKKSEGLGERIGYYGEQLVLFAKTLGLDSCWVGLTYRKTDSFVIAKGEKLACVIALGYGDQQPVSHKSKTAEEVSDISDLTPKWYLKGVEAALKAPTAINQQHFSFSFLGKKDGVNRIKAKRSFSMVGYTDIDLGIAKYHFELGAGRENFEWAE